jgi:hypothetical protein
MKRWNGANHSSDFNTCPPCREVSSQCDTEGSPNLLQRQHIPDVVYRIELSKANDSIKLNPFHPTLFKVRQRADGDTRRFVNRLKRHFTPQVRCPIQAQLPQFCAHLSWHGYFLLSL